MRVGDRVKHCHTTKRELKKDDGTICRVRGTVTAIDQVPDVGDVYVVKWDDGTNEGLVAKKLRHVGEKNAPWWRGSSFRW